MATRTPLAFIAARLFIATFGAGPDDIAVCQKSMFRFRVKVVFGTGLNEPFLLQGMKKTLGSGNMTRPCRPSIMVERELESMKKILNDSMEEIDMFFRGALGEVCAQSDRNAMFIGSADIKNIMATQPLKACIAVAREVGACDMAKMEGAVGIRQGRSNQDLLLHGCSRMLFCSCFDFFKDFTERGLRVAEHLIAADRNGEIAKVKITCEQF